MVWTCLRAQRNRTPASYCGCSGGTTCGGNILPLRRQMRKAVFIMQLCENGGNYYSALNGRQMSWNTSMSIKSGFRFEFPTREDYKLLEKVLRSSKEIRTLELSAEQVADLRKHYFIASRNGHDVICDVRSRKPLLTEELALDILNEEFQVNGRKGLLDFVEDLKSYYHSVPNAFVHDFFADKVQTSDSRDTSSTELWQEDVVHEQRFKGANSFWIIKHR